MDDILTISLYLKSLYTIPAISFVIFSSLFLLLYGTKSFKPSHGTMNEAAHNLLLILLNSVLLILLFSNISLLSSFIYKELGVPHISKDFWANIPKPVSFIITLLMLDFANYWAHRLLHSKYLWGIHVLHHSDKHMTWTTSYRIHIFEYVLMATTFVFTIGWMSLPAEAVGLAAMFRHWHSKFIHCQLGWTFGPFRKVISSPNYHRWHHSVAPEAFDKNLCDMFPIWDILFGTHYDPGLCETDIGVDDGPDGFILGQLYPFKYALEALKKRLGNKQSQSQEALPPA